MNLQELVNELESMEIRLEATGNRLRYFPAEKVTAELRRQIVAHKEGLLRLFRDPSEGLHFALKDKGVLGKPELEPCLVGCGGLVRFYTLEGESLGYCARCDMHQRIVTTPI